MTHKLIFFFRKTNPVFFSLERVFGGILQEVRARYGGEFDVAEWKMPFYSKAGRIWRNIAFTSGRQSRINHITGDVHYAILGCNRKNINILTIHDCVPLHKYAKTDWHYWLLKWIWYCWPVRKADHVTVISDPVRDELLRLTKADPQKITVIPNFVDASFEPAPALFNARRPRILFIGTTPNKNLERLVIALSGLPVVLDIIGELSKEQTAGLRRQGISFERSAGLSAEAVLRKYRECDLLAFPSTYEGFGLPVIEAQAIGRPVLTSNLSPMKDIAGGAACLVDPEDPESMRQGLLSIIHDDAYRQGLVEAGWRNIKRFRLENVAGQYVSLYRELLLRKPGSGEGNRRA